MIAWILRAGAEETTCTLKSEPAGKAQSKILPRMALTSSPRRTQVPVKVATHKVHLSQADLTAGSTVTGHWKLPCRSRHLSAGLP